VRSPRINDRADAQALDLAKRAIALRFRNEHIPAYGVSPLLIKSSDRFSHGLNERIPVGDVRPSMAYMLALLTELSK
jgi:hypothetical protein